MSNKNLVTFKQYERATSLLEDYSPDDLRENDTLLEGLDIKTVDLVNSYLIGEGILDGLKNWIQKKIPGSILNKANKILTEYEKNKMHTLELVGNEWTKTFKARTDAEANPTNKMVGAKFEEVRQRANKAIQTYESAEKDKLEAIEKQLEILMRGKGDRVRNYIELKLAQLKEKVAKAKLKDAAKLTDEAELKKLQDIVNHYEAEVAARAKKLEAEAAGKDVKVEKPKAGEKYKYYSNKEKKEVEVTIAPDDDQHPGNADNYVTVIFPSNHALDVDTDSLKGFKEKQDDAKSKLDNIDKTKKELEKLTK